LMSCPLGRTDPGLRRDDDVLTSVGLRRANQGIECRKIQANEIPISVAPAEAGVQASARMARRFFAWIPAYAGTTVLEPVGLRRDDKVLSVARSKETRSQSPSLRRRPESRHSRAWRATSLTGSRPTPGRRRTQFSEPTPGRPRYRVSQDPRNRDANLRRSGGGRSPGFARMARHVFAWI